MQVLLLTLLLPGLVQADDLSDAAYQAGVAAYAAADYRGAITSAEAATAADPKHWQAWQLDGNARYALGDKAGALTVYKYSLAINPGNPQLKAFVDSMEPPPASPPAAIPGPTTVQGPTHTAGFLDRCSVGGWIGMGFGAPGLVNQGRKQFLTDASAEAVKYGDVVTEAKSSDMKSGVTGGLEFGMDLIDHVAVALRFGSLSGGSGTLKFSEGFSSDWGGGNVYSSYTDYESELGGLANAVTLGARWSYDLTPRLAIGAGLFGGLGFGSMDETASITMRNAGTGVFAGVTSTPPLAWTQIWSGSGPVGEALVSARYRFGPHFILGLDAGYRYLVIAAMKAAGLVTLTEDSDGNGSQDFVVYQVNPGDPYRNLRYDLSGFDARFLPTGGPVPFNFSGLEATLTATVHF